MQGAWRDVADNKSLRCSGAMRLKSIFRRASGGSAAGRDSKREERVIQNLEYLCYQSASSKEEYVNRREFEILLHRVASEKAKRRREPSPKSANKPARGSAAKRSDNDDASLLLCFVEMDRRRKQNQEQERRRKQLKERELSGLSCLDIAASFGVEAPPPVNTQAQQEETHRTQSAFESSMLRISGASDFGSRAGSTMQDFSWGNSISRKRSCGDFTNLIEPNGLAKRQRFGEHPALCF